MESMNLHDFYYDLPQELIAQDPLSDRSSSRLMVLDKKTGEIQHKIFKDVIDYLNPGDCLVINDTKVIPARLIGEKVGTGAAIEVLLLTRKQDLKDTWEVLVKPGKKAKIGTQISFGGGKLIGEIVDIVEEGNRMIQFTYDGILKKYSMNWVRCRFHRISHTVWRIRTVTRPFMQSMKVLQRHRQRVFILQKNCWKGYRRRVLKLPVSRCMSDLERSVR